MSARARFLSFYQLIYDYEWIIFLISFVDFCAGSGGSTFHTQKAQGKTAETRLYNLSKVVQSGHHHSKAGNFKTFLLSENGGRESECEEIILHKAIGPHVGSRIWKAAHDAAMNYGMAPAIARFLTQQNVNGKHVAEVLETCTDLMCLAELKCLGIWYFSIYQPLLYLLHDGNHNLACHIPPVIQKIDSFLERIAENPKEAQALLLLMPDLMPDSFLDAKQRKSMTDTYTHADGIAMESLYQSDSAIDQYVVQCMQITAAATRKKLWSMGKGDVMKGPSPEVIDEVEKCRDADNIIAERMFSHTDRLLGSNSLMKSTTVSGLVEGKGNKTFEFFKEAIKAGGDRAQFASKVFKLASSTERKNEQKAKERDNIARFQKEVAIDMHADALKGSENKKKEAKKEELLSQHLITTQQGEGAVWPAHEVWQRAAQYMHNHSAAETCTKFQEQHAFWKAHALQDASIKKAHSTLVVNVTKCGECMTNEGGARKMTMPETWAGHLFKTANIPGPKMDALRWAVYNRTPLVGAEKEKAPVTEPAPLKLLSNESVLNICATYTEQAVSKPLIRSKYLRNLALDNAAQ